MLKASIILFIIALAFLAFYLFLLKLSGKKKKKRKSGAKKQRTGGSGRRLTGALTVVFFIACAVTFIIYVKTENVKLFGRLKSYDIKESYVSLLGKKDAIAAYPLLPEAVFAQGDDYYLVNGKKDAFKMFVRETDENGEEYGFETSGNGVLQIGGERTLTVTLRQNGELVLDGYLLYSKYDEKFISFDEKVIARDVESFSATDNSLFYVTKSGALYAMGFNEYGQLGDSTTKNKAEPVFIMDGVSCASVSSTHALITDKFGTLYAVGDNSYSQLGNKNAISSTELTKVMQGVKDAKAGRYYSLVLAVNGELYVAGVNDMGQLGNGGEDFRAQMISIMTGVDKIAIYGDTCAALTLDGELYVWGDNREHKAGSGEGEIIVSPVKISSYVYDFALGRRGAVILTADRDVVVTNKWGGQTPALLLGATVPEEYRVKHPEFETPKAEEV